MADNLKTIDTVDPRPFKKLVMTIGELPSSFLESMTYYEMLAWFVDFLQNKVIPALNNNAEAVKELQKAFITLKEFVDNYFANLDVQEEINNKLDQMAEEGTLQEIIAAYIQANVSWTFDNVAEMKSASNLIDGSFAQTLGYYQANDGGASIYKITEAEPSGYYETLNSGVYASPIYRDSVNVECFGAKGNGSEDDTTAIINAVTNVPDNTNVVLSKTYKTTDTIEITHPITITGGGTVKPVISESKLAFKVTGNIIFDNITIDGELNTQDQFGQDVFTDLVLLTGIRITNSTNVTINNVTLKNYYGDAIEFFGYSLINITNCLVDNVGGHWYVNNQYDAFGDGFYFGGTNGESYINIDNCILNGKYKNTTLSRCGVCVENLTTMIDTVTHINMNNTKLNQYDRIIHIEANRGEVWINGANDTLHGNAIFNLTGAVSTIEKAHLTLDNSIISYTGNDYSGTRGLRAFTIAITNSKIDASTTGAIGNYGTVGYYDNCEFNGITNKLMCVTNGNLTIKNSTLNFAEAVSYIFYGSNIITFDKCTFNGVGDSFLNSSNERCDVYSCKFNSFVVRGMVGRINCFKDLNSVINMSGNFTMSTAYKITYRAASFYIDGALQFLPNIGSSIPLNNIKKLSYVTRRDVPASGTIPILPTWDTDNGYRANSRYILISVSTNDWLSEAQARGFNNVYYNYITTDNNGTPTIGNTQQKGTVGSSYAFTIDDTNHTFARSGNLSSMCISFLLDISDLNYLSNWA